MAWYSILPSHLTVYETWIVRTFLFLAVLNLSPWLLAIFYDLILWLCRCIWFEIPGYGGRARGETRPRAPTLRDRNRRLSMAEIITGSPHRSHNVDESNLRRREHGRHPSNESIEEEKEDFNSTNPPG